MSISGWCVFRFVFRHLLLHTMHLPLRSSHGCILRKSLPGSLMTLHCAHCLHHARRVGSCQCDHPALLKSGSCCSLHQEPGKSRLCLFLSNLSARCQSEKYCSDSAGLFGRLVPAYLSLKVQCVSHPLSNLRLCRLPHVSYFSDEACTHRVHVDCYLFTEWSSSRRSFLNWATPVKLCNILICMLIVCILHQFSSPIHKGILIPSQKHFVNELKKQVIDVRC